MAVLKFNLHAHTLHECRYSQCTLTVAHGLPPPIESRKSLNLSILPMSGPGKFSRVESN